MVIVPNATIVLADTANTPTIRVLRLMDQKQPFVPASPAAIMGRSRHWREQTHRSKRDTDLDYSSRDPVIMSVVVRFFIIRQAVHQFRKRIILR
jgi:hypothetical protein